MPNPETSLMRVGRAHGSRRPGQPSESSDGTEMAQWGALPCALHRLCAFQQCCRCWPRAALTSEQQAAAERADDENKCFNYGFQAGTDAFAHCMMNTASQREAQQAADRRMTAAQQAATDRQNAAIKAQKDAADHDAGPQDRPGCLLEFVVQRAGLLAAAIPDLVVLLEPGRQRPRLHPKRHGQDGKRRRLSP